MAEAEVEKRPRRTEQIKAYVTLEEFALIMESSDRAGLSMSEFARRVCLGFRVESREDQQARRELLKVNADLGRLGRPAQAGFGHGPPRNRFTGCSIRLISFRQP